MTAPVQEKEPGLGMQFHIMPEQDLFPALDSSATGLSTAQAAAHRERSGPNDISHIRKRPVILQFLGHFKNLLVIILLFAATISVFVGDITDAAIIFIIVIASVTLDFFQEYKAENAAELLRQKILTKASVTRDGKEEELPITDLVPGDIVHLAAGDIVPADARVLASRDFYVNQSALTGEPFPGGKKSPAWRIPAGHLLRQIITSFWERRSSAVLQQPSSPGPVLPPSLAKWPGPSWNARRRQSSNGG